MVIPIQVTQEGVIIPKTYLRDASNVDVVVTPEYVIVKPREEIQAASPEPSQSRRYSFVGIGETRNPTASVEVEAILEREVTPRAGWSVNDDGTA
jgi:hypothetical protein